MSNIIESLDPYKQIVFVSQELAETKEGKAFIAAMGDFSRLAEIVQMSNEISAPNGKLPQSKEWVAKCLDKSCLGPSNHRYVGKENGPVAQMMKDMGVVPKTLAEHGTPEAYGKLIHASLGI